MIKEINILRDFSIKPYGRNAEDVAPEEYEDTGENFRKTLLVPALQDSDVDKVVVVLSGYNRYGRSFLDEAFAGLIRKDGFTYQDLLLRLSYQHDSVKAIEETIRERIEKAARDKGQL